MPFVEIGQMPADGTKQMPSLATRQRQSGGTAKRPVLPIDICLVSADKFLPRLNSRHLSCLNGKKICLAQEATAKAWFAEAATTAD